MMAMVKWGGGRGDYTINKPLPKNKFSDKTAPPQDINCLERIGGGELDCGYESEVW